MAGPIVEAIKDFTDRDFSGIGAVGEADREVIAEERKEQLQGIMNQEGGCCNAAMAAEASREEESHYR